MHKPARPKSAKGHSRTSHPVVDRSEKRSNATTVSVFSKSGPQGQSSGPGSTSTAYQHSDTAASLRSRSSHRPNTQTAKGDASKEYITHHSPFSEDVALTATSQQVPESEVGPDRPIYFPEIDRPTSSLSKYHILPAISSPSMASYSGTTNTHSTSKHFSEVTAENEVDLLTEKAQQMILDSALQRLRQRNKTPPNNSQKRKVAKGVDLNRKRAKVLETKSAFASNKITRLPPKPRIPREPGPNEDSLLIALKLPDGTRKERRFLPDTNFHGILVYAHSQYPIVPISQCNVFRMDTIPKKLISDLDKTLQDLQIQNRTVLYIEESDDF